MKLKSFLKTNFEYLIYALCGFLFVLWGIISQDNGQLHSLFCIFFEWVAKCIRYLGLSSNKFLNVLAYIAYIVFCLLPLVYPIIKWRKTKQFKKSVTATVYYTYELQFASVNAFLIMKTTDNKMYYDDNKSNTYSLTNIVDISTTLSLENNNTSTVNGKEVNLKKEIFEGTLNFKLIDNLNKAVVNEFNAKNELIKSQEITVQDYVDSFSYNYTATDECDYIVVEKHFEVKYNDKISGKSVGDTYVEREIISQSDQSKVCNLLFPMGNGFANSKCINITFQK